MLKSLYSGVSGLQSHQIAMDVESNNIANVNTTGFKYSRANFSNLLAQTKSIATAPQGELGGKNAVQVGLGSTVSSMTTIFSQGSIQNTDKNTDVAIQGDGFFIVSPDGGSSYNYTRAGDFKFDASGNFVDNNGYIVQGWVRDPVTGKVDSTAPIENINIPPGLTTPASPTTEVTLKANLNAGTLVESFSPAYEVPSGTPPAAPTPAAVDANGNPITSGDLGVMFNDTGEAFSLQEDQGIWASFVNSTAEASLATNSSTYATSTPTANAAADDDSIDIDFTINGTTYTVSVADSGVANTAAENGTRYADEINTQLSTLGASGITATYDSATGELIITDTNASPSTIDVTNAGNTGYADADSLTTGGNQLDITFQLDDGTTTTITTSGGSGLESAAENGARYVSAINAETATTGISASYDITTGLITLVNTNSNAASSHNIRLTVGTNDNSGLDSSNDATTAYKYQYNPVGASGGDGGAGNNKTFKTIADLRNQMELQANGVDVDGDGIFEGSNIEISVSDQGKIEVVNKGGAGDSYDMNLAITGLTEAGVTENTNFTRNMEALNASLPAGSTGKAFSQSFNAATHSSSIDIFDSLGSKHTLRMEFRKTDLNATTGSTWDMLITVPEPSTIDNVSPYNEKTGSIKFNTDGSLAAFTPPNVSFTGNNGSAPEQQVSLNFGTSNDFDGMTSFDSRSSTSGISQDGFTGGDLVGIRIDQSGTVVGSFSNGRSFGLAQVGMAKFTNNEGLVTEGGNVYAQTANSGDPIIGTAATSGRGFIQSSALEASNVDLSLSLTQLIIIQRGYQANGKTITTSDQLLETLIGLKR